MSSLEWGGDREEQTGGPRALPATGMPPSGHSPGQRSGSSHGRLILENLAHPFADISVCEGLGLPAVWDPKV